MKQPLSSHGAPIRFSPDDNEPSSYNNINSSSNEHNSNRSGRGGGGGVGSLSVSTLGGRKQSLSTGSQITKSLLRERHANESPFMKRSQLSQNRQSLALGVPGMAISANMGSNTRQSFATTSAANVAAFQAASGLAGSHVINGGSTAITRSVGARGNRDSTFQFSRPSVVPVSGSIGMVGARIGGPLSGSTNIGGAVTAGQMSKSPARHGSLFIRSTLAGGPGHSATLSQSVPRNVLIENFVGEETGSSSPNTSGIGGGAGNLGVVLEATQQQGQPGTTNNIGPDTNMNTLLGKPTAGHLIKPRPETLLNTVSLNFHPQKGFFRDLFSKNYHKNPGPRGKLKDRDLLLDDADNMGNDYATMDPFASIFRKKKGTLIYKLIVILTNDNDIICHSNYSK